MSSTFFHIIFPRFSTFVPSVGGCNPSSSFSPVWWSLPWWWIWSWIWSLPGFSKRLSSTEFWVVSSGLESSSSNASSSPAASFCVSSLPCSVPFNEFIFWLWLSTKWYPLLTEYASNHKYNYSYLGCHHESDNTNSPLRHRLLHFFQLWSIQHKSCWRYIL